MDAGLLVPGVVMTAEVTLLVVDDAGCGGSWSSTEPSAGLGWSIQGDQAVDYLPNSTANVTINIDIDSSYIDAYTSFTIIFGTSSDPPACLVSSTVPVNSLDFYSNETDDSDTTGGGEKGDSGSGFENSSSWEWPLIGGGSSLIFVIVLVLVLCCVLQTPKFEKGKSN